MKVSENAKRTREHKYNRSLGILRIRTIIWEMEGKTEHLGKIIKEDSPPRHTHNLKEQVSGLIVLCTDL